MFGRPFVAPPGVSDVKAGLRKAFDTTLNKDHDFMADAKKAKLGIDPVSGAEVERLVSQLFRSPKAVIQRATAVIKTE